MFSKVIVNSIASNNFKHKHKSVNKNTPSLPYMSLTKESLILIGRAYVARDCYLLLPGLVAKAKKERKSSRKM